MNPETLKQIELYWEGALDEASCQRLEALALSDPAVAELLDREVDRVGECIRRDLPLRDLPEGAFNRIRSHGKPRWAWRPLGLLVGSCALIVLTVALWPKGLKIQLERSQGPVALDGRMMEIGDQASPGERIVASQGAEFGFDGVRVRISSPVAILRPVRKEGSLQVDLEVGEAHFLDDHAAPSYRVAAAGLTFQPLGTRFAVSSGSAGQAVCSVYEKAVRVLGGYAPVDLRAGSESTGKKADYVKDDPGAIPIGARMLVPTADGLEWKVRGEDLSIRMQNRSRLRALILAASARPSSKVYMDLAEEYARLEDRSAAGDLAALALDMDPTLRSCQADQVLRVLRSQAANMGSAKCARKLAEALSLRKGVKAAHADALAKIAEDWGDGIKAIEAGRALWRFGQEEDKLLVAEALVYGYIKAPVDPSVLEEADRVLWEIIKSKERWVTQEIRATAYHRLGESTFYSGRKRKSVEYTLAAVKLWPKPRWMVHAGTRMAESGAAPLEEALKWNSAGLVQAPTWYAYERAAVSLHVGGSGSADRQRERQLVEWMGDTFTSVPEAQARVSEWLSWVFEDEEASLRYRRRAIALYGGIDHTPQQYRNNWAISLWKLGRRDEALQMGNGPNGLDAGVLEYMGRLGEALVKLRETPDDEWTLAHDLVEAHYLRKLGKDGEALKRYVGYIRYEDAHLGETGFYKEPGLLLDALVAAAELDGDPTRAKGYAKQVLELMEQPFDMSLRGKAHWRLFEARACMVLGLRERASRTLHALIDSDPLPEEQREAEALLRGITHLGN